MRPTNNPSFKARDLAVSIASSLEIWETIEGTKMLCQVEESKRKDT